MKILRISDVGHIEAAETAARALQAGGIVLFPTDTLYGLAVDAQNKDALERLYQLKGREKHKPVSLIVSDIDQVAEHAELHESARLFAQTHLPGALTLVLAGKPHLHESLMHSGAVGMRIPDDTFALALATVFNNPYTATSANRSGEETLPDPLDIVVNFKEHAHLIDLVIDDGPRAGGVPSTVVLYTTETPLVLRDGALSREQLGID